MLIDALYMVWELLGPTKVKDALAYSFLICIALLWCTITVECLLWLAS